MEEREKREEKALLLTEQEAVIKWQYIQSFSFVWVGFQRVQCHATKSKLVILFLLDVTNSQPCLTNPKAKEMFWPGSYTHSLAQLLSPLLILLPQQFPSGFFLKKTGNFESEWYLLNHSMFTFSSRILITQYKEIWPKRNTFLCTFYTSALRMGLMGLHKLYTSENIV